MDNNPVQLADLQRLFRGESPDLAELLVAYLNQEDPDLFAVEPPPPVEGDDETERDEPASKEPPEGFISLGDLKGQLRSAGAKRSTEGRRKAAWESWQKFLAQDPSLLPPRFALSDLVEALYERNTPSARSLLLQIIEDVPLKFGLWRGLKRIYKKAEATLDAEVFGALAASFDLELSSGSSYERDVSDGTVAYLRRRSWRFLLRLGQSVPELYTRFAAETLRHYGVNINFAGLWVANHIVGHGAKHYDARSFSGKLPPDDMAKHRAFPDAWKQAADTLMFLLEACRCDEVARFAIQGLQKDFPDRLRAPTPAWLARIAGRRFESVDEFFVETLLGSPDFHQGKLRGLGLHDAVLSMLDSSSKKARKYAVEYARAHARDLASDRLFDLLSSDEKEVVELAKTLLLARPPRELGHVFLGRLLTVKVTNDWATKALSESFERKELPTAFLVDMLYGEDDQREWAKEYIEKKYPGPELGARFWVDVLDDKRSKDGDDGREVAFKFLGKYKAADIGADWLLDALTRSWLNDDVATILKKAQQLPGLDVERVKGMVFNASFREAALAVLSNPKLVTAKQIGLPWLLTLAKRADPSLHEFAHRYLLEHMKPADFADGDAKAGVARLFGLALGEREPEPVRVFAQTYLRCHHPGLGPEQAESKQFDLKPYLKESDYEPERLWGALFDGRADVRQFALLLVRPHLRKWNLHTKVYELTDQEPKEIRNLAYEALEGAGDEGADPAVALKLDELSAAPIFQMTESLRRPTRDVAMGLIRKHYRLLGGAERLGWLMQSADREVRLFAVRLLWEKHRPRAFPAGWKPRKAAEIPLEDGGHFADVEALRGLLRRLLFGLPPGRAPAGDGEAKRRHVSASVIKRNVVDLVRDLGVEDAAFAALAAPVLQEFTGSLARGEWQACLSALSHLNSAHPELGILRSLWRNIASGISRKFALWPRGPGCWCWAGPARAATAR